MELQKINPSMPKVLLATLKTKGRNLPTYISCVIARIFVSFTILKMCLYNMMHCILLEAGGGGLSPGRYQDLHDNEPPMKREALSPRLDISSSNTYTSHSPALSPRHSHAVSPVPSQQLRQQLLSLPTTNHAPLSPIHSGKYSMH